MKNRKCSLCGNAFTGMGNNPEPLLPYARRCCNDCNATRVVPERLRRMFNLSQDEIRKEDTARRHGKY